MTAFSKKKPAKTHNKPDCFFTRKYFNPLTHSGHIGMSTLGLLLLILLFVLLWQFSMRTRDLAIRIAINTCKKQGVQFLDGTAALQSIKPLFSLKTGPVLRQTYTFDYSEDGITRHTGCIIMHNTTISTVLLEQ